ncbi:hypothetical protein EJ05DRAFT_497956 [Pseudovirgaria hyperparasitica]|uniref:Uncharacterized protein n=1 Tax=Pseudovirgaria hyperparasitica TaxID=470096 RepID=A0A6A6WHD7_9PEZI|nr:uncharacterized protein EJ05DRAFT_497956 [Pseudovirgaria hyperparasitica]KAF2761406.1 hypothetical protein EJ05DRAFT_497956 [Pseudovirgaria hyperparasitica]
MPRDGSGAADNAIDAGQTQVHGVGKSDAIPDHTKTNVAPMPEPEKGAAIEGMDASGGGSAGIAQRTNEQLQKEALGKK